MELGHLKHPIILEHLRIYEEFSAGFVTVTTDQQYSCEGSTSS